MSFRHSGREQSERCRIGIVEVPDTEMHRERDAALMPSQKRIDTDCDLYGRIRIDGVEYLVRGWNRRDPAGRPWLKLRLLPQ